MGLLRRCSRTACGRPATTTLTYVYADHDRGGRPARDLCRAARLRPLRPAQRAALRPPRLGGAPPRPRRPRRAVLRRPARAGRRRPRGGAAAPGRAAAQPARPVEGVRRGHLRPSAPRTDPACSAGSGRHRVGALSTSDAAALAAIFKAYDVRGTVPDQIDEDLARRVGNAFVTVTGAESVVVGPRHAAVLAGDVPCVRRGCGPGRRRRRADRARLHRPALLRLRSPAAARRDVHGEPQPGAATTASSCAAPTPRRSGWRPGWPRSATGSPAETMTDCRDPGAITEQDVLADYATYLRRLAPVRGRHLEVVVDAGNGMAGLTAPAVLGRVDVEVEELYFELDGTFPNHEANPIEPANLVDLQARVRRDRRRHRPGLRRRRRPVLPGRRARRAGQPERAHRADRRPRAGQGSPARRSSTT